MIIAIVIYLAIAFGFLVFSDPGWFEAPDAGRGCKWYQALFWPLYSLGLI